jgi:hypothetical protein
MNHELYSGILKSVSKPGRYTGGEFNQILKNKEDVAVRFAFCFPDTYEIGMSNLGVRILYDVLNRKDSVWCERVYAPWLDMQEKMREFGIPLSALEIGDPVRPDPQRPSLILCRAGERSLWELAKQCGSTVDAICRANQLTGEPAADKILLIPVQ